jgi:PAP2 superfamily protein
VSGLTLSNAPMRPARPVGGVRKWWHSRLGAPLLLEIVIVVSLLLIYKAARLLAEGDHRIAVQHALQVIDIERALGVFNEENAQRLVIKSTAAIKFLNVYYLWAHFSVTIAMLVWLYVKKPLGYLSVRRVLVVVTALGLVGHALYPLAPPRLLDAYGHSFGFIDTALKFGPNSYGAKGTYGNLANQFAAMPSLHFAWAVVVAWGVVKFAKSRWRYLAVLHPVFTLLAIVLTANHYWIDAAVGLILVPIGILGDRYLPHWHSKHRHLPDTPVAALAAADGADGSSGDLTLTA